MCGIGGIVSLANDSFEVGCNKLVALSEALSHRGPDGSGSWIAPSGNVGLVHRRLAIMDPHPRAAQPMSTENGTTITFNGEIYNASEIRADLQASGVSFRTYSDTEVIVRLFERDGTGCLPQLVGMYAFAIWDPASRNLFAARDPYGIKPFYYSVVDGVLYFASELTALREVAPVEGRHSEAGWVGFYLWGFVPEPFTVYGDAKQLRAGAMLIFSETGLSLREQDLVEETLAGGSSRCCSNLGAIEILEKEIVSSVERHCVSDVPVSLFLSGGADSQLIANLLGPEIRDRMLAATVDFSRRSEEENTEGDEARSIAYSFSMRHHVEAVSEDSVRESVWEVLSAMDQPSIDGPNVWWAAKAVRAGASKVALSGTGGDELVGGYPSHEQVPRWLSNAGNLGWIPGLRHAWRELGKRASHFQQVPPKAPWFFDLARDLPGAYLLRRGVFLPAELEGLLGPRFLNEGMQTLEEVNGPYGLSPSSVTDPRLQVGIWENTMYLRNQLLRDSDWASMAHGVEVRTPLVDIRLLENLVPAVGAEKMVRLGKEALRGVMRNRRGSVSRQPQKKPFAVPQLQMASAAGYKNASCATSLARSPSRLWCVAVADSW